MSNTSVPGPAALPARPSLRHLKQQAKDLLAAGEARSLAQAQCQIARHYGFANWPRLKAHVESITLAGQLKAAIDDEDAERVISLISRHPSLHRAPLGYHHNGPLTWVAECRVPYRPPSAARLAIAKWMIDNGSDVHQGGDGPLMRAALNGDRIPMMELLVAAGADPNARWNGNFPIVFAPCESVDPAALEWLLEHGADPNPPGVDATALDYVIGTYARSPNLARCIDLLRKAGATSRYDVPPLLDLLTGRTDLLEQHLDADPSLLERRFPEFTFGTTAGRRLTLRGATLLHVAAEFGRVDGARILLRRGADVNARATVDEAGIGGQTPLFHAASQNADYGLAVVTLLVDHGAGLNVTARLPGHYESPNEFLECTPLSYAERFPGGPSLTLSFLREKGALSEPG